MDVLEAVNILLRRILITNPIDSNTTQYAYRSFALFLQIFYYHKPLQYAMVDLLEQNLIYDEYATLRMLKLTVMKYKYNSLASVELQGRFYVEMTDLVKTCFHLNPSSSLVLYEYGNLLFNSRGLLCESEQAELCYLQAAFKGNPKAINKIKELGLYDIYQSHSQSYRIVRPSA